MSSFSVDRFIELHHKIITTTRNSERTTMKDTHLNTNIRCGETDTEREWDGNWFNVYIISGWWSTILHHEWMHFHLTCYMELFQFQTNKKKKTYKTWCDMDAIISLHSIVNIRVEKKTQLNQQTHYKKIYANVFVLSVRTAKNDTVSHKALWRNCWK